jgi:sulfur-oxidizing protein SoxY
MGMMRRKKRGLSIREALLIALLAACILAFASPNAAHAQTTTFDPAKTGQDDSAERAARWKALQEAIFGQRKVENDTASLIQLEAPPRALDAALVPISIDIAPNKSVKSVWLVIDNNPGPLAGHFTFGPKADPRTLKLRVRVNEYTYIHAVAETNDGKLYGTEKFVKAAGGCSAPAGADDAEALKSMGLMKLKLLNEFSVGQPVQAQLMIRHPNFNGMQMNQVTRMYTPARFIKSTDVSYNGGSVFHLDSDISLATDPVITFGFVPREKGKLKVVVTDSKDGKFDQTFDVPAAPVS